MNNIETFRPRSGYIFAGIVWAIFVGVFVQVLLEGNLRTTFVAAGIAGFACGSAWLIYVRPKVVFGDEGVEVVNPLRRYKFSWAAVDRIDTKYALEFYVESKKIGVFAAPAPSRYHARTLKSHDVAGMGYKPGEQIRAGDSPRSHSGVAAHMARTKLKAFKAAKGKGSQQLTTRFNYTGAAVLLASVVLLFL